MPLFQQTVVQKYLKTQNKAKLQEKWSVYQAHFLNPTIQENIRNSKEEQYQEGFLRDLFVPILGYTLNPDAHFNLTTELKNIKDSKKADGGILVNDKVVAVIELKGTNTTDLNKIEAQAFGYKNNQAGCTYVITSNFEKLRFYIDNAIEHIEFNLFQLTEKEFELLYLCLAYENLSQNIPKKLKEESVSQEDVITKKLYKDYSVFKRELFQNLVQLNPDYDGLLLFKKSQKLLDRFLFLFFAEDRYLLPPNSVRLILQQWKQLQELDEYKPLYDRFKKYFEYLNTGYKGKKYEVFAYNGGLFKLDEVLDTVKIDDKLLYEHTLKLSEYDFASEVDVNILGHIFENSLNEIEEVQSELEGQTLDKTKTKRKKDGVFYTPKYITKYIVENTIGKLCIEQKEALQLNEEEYTNKGINPLAKKRQKKTIKDLVDKLDTYRNWLLQLTIIDPACGSGAFLNEALNFLIAEHQYIDELQAKLLGGGLVFPNIENSILENNLFGVDLNEESVEIAKLSLWLRTAQPNRKLNDLSNNIKCGNSLIDDPAIAGDKAFNWEQEFPRVFKEKNKKAWHITTAIHDSRTSQRMIDYKVREKRDMGTNPYPQVHYLTPEDEAIITQTLAEIVVEKKLNLLQYNICKDHMHLVLVCEEEELPTIMQHIKGKTARTHNSNKGINPLVQKENEKSAPLWTQKYGCNEITSQEQLHNTIAYIQNNRIKHELPPHPKKTALLIENMLCTYEQAFTPEYNGGFDVVIGNPPYVKEYTSKQAFNGLHSNPCYQGKMDLWYFFGWLALEIIKPEVGLIGYIAPNNWITNSGASVFRNIVLEKGKILEFIDFGDFKVFDSAGIQTMIYIMKQTSDNNNYKVAYSKVENKNINHENAKEFLSKLKHENFTYFISEINKTELNDKYIQFINNNINIVLNKISDLKGTYYLDKKEVAQGIVPPQDFVNAKSKIILGDNFEIGDGIFNLSQKEYENLGLSDNEKELVKPFYTSTEIGRYFSNSINNLWVIYTDSKFKNENEMLPYPILKSHLDKFKNVITSDNKPYGLHRSREENFFKGEKILSIRKAIIPSFSFIDFDCYVSQSYYIIKTERISLKILTTILNSSVIKFWLKFKGKMQGEIFQIDKEPILNIPIPKIPLSAQQPFIEKADQMLSLNKEFQLLAQKFQRTLQRKFEGLEILPKKLENWHELTFADFVKELGKKKIPLTLSEEAEWEDYFLSESQKALALKTQIDTTDKEIDAMVYALYGLSEEEIEIIENS